MQNQFSTKEEDSEEESIHKILKKEEEGYIKREEYNDLTYTNYLGSIYNSTLPYSIKTEPEGSDSNSLIPINIDINIKMEHDRMMDNRSKIFNIIRPSAIKDAISSVKIEFPVKLEDETVNTERKIVKRGRRRKKKKKTIRVSACKNYIGLLCAGFSRAVLTSEEGDEIYNYIQKLIKERKEKYAGAKENSIEEIIEALNDYIYKEMCGKTVKKSKERDFKIRNTRELGEVICLNEKDNDLVRLIKEVLYEVIDFFFRSNYFNKWLNEGMINEDNKSFFVINKEEIHRKFLEPTLYRPKFNHDFLKGNKVPKC